MRQCNLGGWAWDTARSLHEERVDVYSWPSRIEIRSGYVWYELVEVVDGQKSVDRMSQIVRSANLVARQ